MHYLPHQELAASMKRIADELVFEAVKAAIRIAALAWEARDMLGSLAETQNAGTTDARGRLGWSLWHLELLGVRIRQTEADQVGLLDRLGAYALTCELNGEALHSEFASSLAAIIRGETTVYDRPTFASAIARPTR